MAVTKKVLVPLAEGFEEIEAVTIVDVLRRAELDVTLAGMGAPGPLEGSRGVRVQPDVDWADVDPAAFDAIVLPGGMGGATRLMEDERVLDAVRASVAAGKLTAAICAAPMVLARAGVVGSHAITSHPSVQPRLAPARMRPTERVVRSGNLITSQGPGTAIEFALALVEELCGPAESAEIARALVAPGGPR